MSKMPLFLNIKLIYATRGGNNSMHQYPLEILVLPIAAENCLL